MDEIFNMIDNHKITVEQHHIDYIENEWNKGYASSRKNCDSLLLEYDLIYKGLVDKPTHIGHDIIKRGFKIDLKEINKWHNINKLPWLVRCTEDGDVTHYSTYRVKGRDKTRLYICGDELSFEAVEICPAKEYLKRASRSQYGGYYITPIPMYKS